DGVELPRAEILKNAFVLRPLADIAPDELHPVCCESYRSLWQSYQKDQKLWPVDFTWQGRQISSSGAVAV
ncbi:MAG: 2-amino-4-hydroxy-6-hydroxymethyldihydropteridine diphosphokinase, partial [Alcanivorax sp.]|nr:2-amino-4-hydroxy-6-hydroxymethyldihydropteridine diphosphokinase [Alcanivorax sp.]